ncbi:intradiol ring-cleavage dioxygenase [Paraflavitalea pollutisoli]|uniref:dioxygenase family protein n=1 Tax=Paraflavitalea pollutisoli TaxID=3034143 RepID=UPI0023ED6521|nr:intradiol ring-cleavage dioxygenase [Paraflavitalea sp. H1-2-19X]
MEQSRKNFLRHLIVGSTAMPLIINACKKGSGDDDGASYSSASGDCAVTDTETDGPYPLYNSRGSAINRVDITDGKTGLPLDMTITVRNVNDSCNVLANARVDVWHCDKDGYYSGYSNSGYLGTQNNSEAVFCRGLQYTDSQGQVKFTSIYPGWYTGRVTHVHAQIYVGTSLKLTTQIAFPDAINTAVYKTSLYSAHGQNSITNAGDNIIQDSLDNELATVTANSTTGGYNLVHTIYVKA